MRLLILDDDDIRHAAFEKKFEDYDRVHVRTVDEAIAALQANEFDVAFLDHDLNMYQYRSMGFSAAYQKNIELTGGHVAAFIASMLPEKRPSFAIVHSWNPAGAESMISILRDAGVTTYKWEFRPTFEGLNIQQTAVEKRV